MIIYIYNSFGKKKSLIDTGEIITSNSSTNNLEIISREESETHDHNSS